MPKLEETIEQVNLKNAKAKQAFLGYARFDVIKNKARLIFGKYNPRPLVTTQVQGLVHSFHVDGVDRFNPQFSIPLIVDKSILQPGCWAPDMECVDSLPDLEISEDAPTDWEIVAAGGQHRVAALEDWLDRKRKQWKELKNEREKHLRQELENVDTGLLVYLNTTLKRDVEELEGVLHNEGRWMVSLFDKGRRLV